ncbi:hypothetical protein [Cytobacillus purgationiresistens]|uniref:Rhodanese-related sulfurtransferase n=1 Tax=Cytobacillus purgationiresistens TaxID=863449 RepID=A0ABU0AI20_9BACI|nr:hypothetical protein [Cytobacillus purgationiresistens]MDQ0270442.1 rhodanese-related sulfurtransferase [Cytobacillus purgationiresistens]
MLLLLLIAVIIAVYLNLRNRPIKGVEAADSFDQHPADVKILDVRDYNQSYQSPILDSINIPVAYLNRYYHASSQIEENMSIRFLRKKGFSVIGYPLTNKQI